MVGPVEGPVEGPLRGPVPPFVDLLEKWGRSAAEEREDAPLCAGQLERWCRGALGQSPRGAPMKGRRMSNTDGNPSGGAGVAKEADGAGLSVGKFGIGGKSLAGRCGLGGPLIINGPGCLPATPDPFHALGSITVCKPEACCPWVLSERLPPATRANQLLYSQLPVPKEKNTRR